MATPKTIECKKPKQALRKFKEKKETKSNQTKQNF
jgi:hypothetical protein